MKRSWADEKKHGYWKSSTNGSRTIEGCKQENTKSTLELRLKLRNANQQSRENQGHTVKQTNGNLETWDGGWDREENQDSQGSPVCSWHYWQRGTKMDTRKEAGQRAARVEREGIRRETGMLNSRKSMMTSSLSRTRISHHRTDGLEGPKAIDKGRPRGHPVWASRFWISDEKTTGPRRTTRSRGVSLRAHSTTWSIYRVRAT